MSFETVFFSFQKALKSICKPEIIPGEYWKNIIWVAQDLKKVFAEGSRKSLNLLATKHVTLLFLRPHGRFQLAFSLACDILSTRRTLYQDCNFENQINPSDSGRVLSTLTDMFILHGFHQSFLSKVVAGATVPVFSASSDTYCLQKALSDMMTYYEKFSHLKGLTVAWIGPPNSIFNSYLVLCSHFGMNVRYTLICSIYTKNIPKTVSIRKKLKKTPKHLERVLGNAYYNVISPRIIYKRDFSIGLGSVFKSESYGAGYMSPVHVIPTHKPEIDNQEFSMKEFKMAAETVEGADIVAISMHPEEKNKITSELLKKSNPNYVVMHSLPRGDKEVSSDIFNLPNDLTWKTTENYLYIAMAIILTGLTDYTPRVPMPNI